MKIVSRKLRDEGRWSSDIISQRSFNFIKLYIFIKRSIIFEAMERRFDDIAHADDDMITYDVCVNDAV
jgi:hypothetical protein